MYPASSNNILLCGVLAFGIGILLHPTFMLASSGEPNLQSSIHRLLDNPAVYRAAPCCFFCKPCCNYGKIRRRFDLVLARINGILVLALSLILCFISLEYRQGGERLILPPLPRTKGF